MNDLTASFRAGAKRVCITPDLPCEMAGYFHSRVARSVARDLYATAIAVESGGQSAVIVSCDLIGMTDQLCMLGFEQANREYGIPLSHCIACATHTHTGPEVRQGSAVPVCEAYRGNAPGMIADAVMGALGNMQEATLCVGQTARTRSRPQSSVTLCGRERDLRPTEPWLNRHWPSRSGGSLRADAGDLWS
ncbi:MAG: hypothetical protein HN742_22400 [Lentisphaerae bacterium]|jgi:neutral ceramidase|nr:hypothetical protein [Lentisphaerota bacterium]MBT4817521.1 hypothetical protein [Lentisphaerota bacterium]MBT5604986.1 hypothetical protein [Lentisphaerota bacterium]MBT7054616.1 hypothetical protein [Lentisphaerota bacterium]MBT7844645.1 hypothetical protein [Lentisphaerota bacterium]